jgi:hypothetical protein
MDRHDLCEPVHFDGLLGQGARHRHLLGAAGHSSCVQHWQPRISRAT